MFKIGVLVSGGGTNLQALIDNIENKYINAEISLVVSNRKNAYALERCRKNDIDFKYIGLKQFQSRMEYENRIIESFNKKSTNLIILAGFMDILSENFVKSFENRIINIHPSLIPAFCGKGYYGIKVHEAVLKRGVKITGATVHFVDEGADTGPIILQKAVLVEDNDTSEILQKRVMEQAEWIILSEAVKLISENKIIVENNTVRRVK